MALTEDQRKDILAKMRLMEIEMSKYDTIKGKVYFIVENHDSVHITDPAGFVLKAKQTMSDAIDSLKAAINSIGV